MLEEVEQNGQGVGVVCKMDFFERDSFHGMGEIGYIGTINKNQYYIGNQINGIQQTLIPPFLAEAEGEDGKQDEEAVGPEHRHGVEHKGAFGNAQGFC